MAAKLRPHQVRVSRQQVQVLGASHAYPRHGVMSVSLQRLRAAAISLFNAAISSVHCAVLCAVSPPPIHVLSHPINQTATAVLLLQVEGVTFMFQAVAGLRKGGFTGAFLMDGESSRCRAKSLRAATESDQPHGSAHASDTHQKQHLQLCPGRL
jgi:hypothetical protein